MRDVNPVTPNAGGRDRAFAAAMRRAEGPPAAEPHPRDPIGRTRAGYVVRRNGEIFAPGTFFDLESVPLLES
jgi:hypothetical protein